MGNTNPTYLTKLQHLQNKAVRIVTNSKLRVSISPHCFILRILKLPELYKLEIAKLMHQHRKQNLLHCFSEFFKPLSSVHERSTTSKSENKLYLLKFSTSRCQKSFKYHGTKMCNSISCSVDSKLIF